MIDLMAAPTTSMPGVVPGAAVGGENGAAQAAPGFTDMLAIALGLGTSEKQADPMLGVFVPEDFNSGSGDKAETQDADTDTDTEADQGAGAQVVRLCVAQPVVTIPVGVAVPVAAIPQGPDVAVPQSQPQQAVEATVRPVAGEAVLPAFDVTETEKTEVGAPNQAANNATASDVEPALRQGIPIQQGEARKLTPGVPAQDDAQAPTANALDLAPDAPVAEAGSDRPQSRSDANSGGPKQQNNAQPEAAQPAKVDFSWPVTEAVRRISSGAIGEMPVQAQAVDAEATGDKPAAETPATITGTTGTDAGVTANSGVESLASKADSQRATPEVHQRVIDQIVKDVKLHSVNGRTDLTIKLQPAELGTLRIRITSDGQGMTSQIEAASPQVRNLLQAHVPLLMDALSTAGVRLDSVSVTSALSFGAWADNLTQQQSQQQQNGNSRRGHGGGGIDPAFVIAEQSAGYRAQESLSYSWLA